MEKILYNITILRNYFIVLVYVLIFFMISLSAASSNSGDNDELLQTLLSVLSDEQVQKVFDHQQPKQGNNAVLSNEQAHEEYVAQQRLRMDFYRDYILKYYPKAFVISEMIFVTMKPDEIERALAKLIDILANQVWKYFVNKDQKDTFKIIHYWEYVVDQMSLIYSFLSQAQISLKDQTVFLPDIQQGDLLWDFSFMQNISRSRTVKKQSTPLLQYLTSKNKTVIFDFYALIFDYQIKLFNEGILLPDLKQAALYLVELDFVGQKLRGSEYEREYTEILKTAHDLILLLKQRLGHDKDSMLYDDALRWSSNKSVNTRGW